MQPVWAVGLMTGTVLDGNIDIALIRSDGETIEEFGAWKLAPYSAEIRPLLAAAVTAALEWQFEGAEPAIFRDAEEALTRAQSAAVSAFLAEIGLAPEEIAIIGFHGQSVLHRAPQAGRLGATRQLGDGELMARLTGIDTAYDFRSADMCAGGQGAPLAPVYHVALLRRIGAGPNSAVLNLGGVANVTWWGGEDRIVGFDTGPANAPLNDWIKQHGLGEMDRDGALAKGGKVDEARLAELLRHPYLSAPYPKSLDRYGFSAGMADGLSAADGAATLTAFTAAAVGKGLDLLPQRPAKLIVCGGGRRNPAIIEALKRRAGVEPVPAEEVGWRGDAIEAECFAYLALRVLRDLPLSFPLTTGVTRAMTGGRLARATKRSQGDRLAQRERNVPSFSELASSPASILPEDWRDAALAGRIWRPDRGGPSVVAIREAGLFDISAAFPTIRDLCEAPEPVAALRASEGEGVGDVAAVLANTPPERRDPSKPWLLAPIDLQAIKAAGVTFAISMLERVIEERARGNPAAANAIRAEITSLVGEDFAKLKPGSPEAMRLKEVLIAQGAWSQYLEVGIGPDAEIFTKAQPMAAVGSLVDAGIHPASVWNNPEPEVVLVVNSRGEIVGATLGNDVNLRDVEGRSALLLSKAKDNNASCAVGPFLRFFDIGFSLDDVRRMTVTLVVQGEDGFRLDGSSSIAKISRDPADLVGQLLNRNHQFPDGAVLFLGTLFAPAEDRDEAGKGFTHKVGDIVTIAAPRLGRLVNRIRHTDQCEPWTFGAGHLMRNLARRGLLGGA